MKWAYWDAYREMYGKHEGPKRSLHRTIYRSDACGFISIGRVAKPPDSVLAELQLVIWPNREPWHLRSGTEYTITFQVEADNFLSARTWQFKIRWNGDFPESHDGLEEAVVISPLSSNKKGRAPLMPEEKKESLLVDTIYREFYQEMRRFRDYEFTSSTWFNTTLLALLGFVVYRKLDSNAESNLPLDGTNWLRIYISVAGTLLAISAAYLIYHCRSRYIELRTWTDDHLEPSWKDFHPNQTKFEPRNLLLLTPILILLAILYFLWVF